MTNVKNTGAFCVELYIQTKVHLQFNLNLSNQEVTDYKGSQESFPHTYVCTYSHADQTLSVSLTHQPALCPVSTIMLVDYDVWRSK